MRLLFMTGLLLLSFTQFNSIFADQKQAETPKYKLESIASIIMTMESYQKPIEAWYKKHRPLHYQQLFEKDEDKAKKKEEKSLGKALISLNASIADHYGMILDFYINKKANAGWEVVTMSKDYIIFKKLDAAKK